MRGFVTLCPLDWNTVTIEEASPDVVLVFFFFLALSNALGHQGAWDFTYSSPKLDLVTHMGLFLPFQSTL
jgi:hypothetical protein